MFKTVRLFGVLPFQFLRSTASHQKLTIYFLEPCQNASEKSAFEMPLKWNQRAVKYAQQT